MASCTAEPVGRGRSARSSGRRAAAAAAPSDAPASSTRACAAGAMTAATASATTNRLILRFLLHFRILPSSCRPRSYGYETEECAPFFPLEAVMPTGGLRGAPVAELAAGETRSRPIESDFHARH